MNQKFLTTLQNELDRIDTAGVTKRHERVIEGFTKELSPKAVINGKNYIVFNSNDYLGLRFNENLRQAEESAVEIYGVGPGAVRFISGTMKIYQELERKIAGFHHRDAAIVFSSAFAANIAVMSCFLKGQSKDSLLNNEVVVISDELNHRSIIDGIRAASIRKEQKKIYQHLDYVSLRQELEQNSSQFKRAVIVTDGVFSMIGEYADVGKLQQIVGEFDSKYEEGVLLIIDDSHGVGAFGNTGRGCEEVTDGKADLLVGTFGKAFGVDGGYIVGDQVLIDYLRESAATYIYSNPVSPSVAAAAKTSVELVSGEQGKIVLQKLQENVHYFQEKVKTAGFSFVANSIHPIQPLLIGDALKAKQLKDKLFDAGILVTNITYPVVAKGKDEIRIQINASHTKEDIDTLISACQKAGRELGILA